MRWRRRLAARRLAREERRLALLALLTQEQRERVLRLRATEALQRPEVRVAEEPPPPTPDPLSLVDRAPTQPQPVRVSRPLVSSSPPPELTLVPPEDLAMPDPVEEIARRSGLPAPPT